MHEDHRDVAEFPVRIRARGRHGARDSLDALTNGNEVSQLIEGESFVSVSPFIVHQDHVVEAEALILHPEEPHAHRARPHHESDELQQNEMRRIPRKAAVTTH